MDRDDFRHWHKPGDDPSVSMVPPLCCASEFRRLLDTIEREHGRALDEAVQAERRRVILTAIDVLEKMGANVAVVLTGREKELAEIMTKHAADAIRMSGCICPDIDISTIGQAAGTTFIKGRDARCGMHERAAP